jgi:hypothetical protein
MQKHRPNPKNNIEAVFRDMKSELACADGHFRCYEQIYNAKMDRKPEMTMFHDFFDMSLRGQLAGMVLSVTRVLDNHSDAATIPWLLKQIESQPDRFPGKAAAVAEMRVQLKQADPVTRKFRQIRNKRIGHLERMSEAQKEAFWEVNILGKEDLEQILQHSIVLWIA